MENVTKVNEATKTVNNVVKKVNKKPTTKKENVVKRNLTDINDENLLNLDLDSVNIFDLLNQNKSLNVPLNKKKDTADGIYKKGVKKENETDKNFRSRIRKIRNGHLDAILDAKKLNDSKLLKSNFEAFNTFYIATYIKNDFSIESLGRKNADKNTLVKIKIVLHIIKTEILTKK